MFAPPLPARPGPTALTFLIVASAFLGRLPPAAAAPPGVTRPPAVPLVTHDPYFSCWSFNDSLAGDWPKHWTGRPHGMCGLVRVDGKTYRWMGGNHPALPAPAKQTGVHVEPLATTYHFDCGGVDFAVRFCSPIVADDLEMVSRPASYVTFTATSSDDRPRKVQVYVDASGEWAVHDVKQAVLWDRPKVDGLQVMRIGTVDQKVLERKGDDVRIDWGHFYVAAPAGMGSTAVGGDLASRTGFVDTGTLPAKDDANMPRAANDEWPVLAFAADVRLTTRGGGRQTPTHVVLAYDDEYAVEYNHEKLRAWWRRDPAMTAGRMLADAEKDFQKAHDAADAFGRKLYQDAERAGGPAYASLLALSYRQALAAHKLVAAPDGAGGFRPFFMSKENFSNGSINTVDITYPSAPLFLVYGPTLLKGMCDPIFDYRESGRWKKPFAPHDSGTYPIANGQTYGEDMPVEESGNMIVLAAAIVKVEGKPDYARQHWKALTEWAEYLKAKGFDPENQLCTDDFAGHLAHNTNLSVKAIMGLASYGQMAGALGQKDVAEEYTKLAKELAAKWVETAADGDHYSLTFDKKGAWSQKYNLVWDKVLGLNVFPPDVAKKEMAFYLTKQNPYGLPLDSRKTYTKNDWILWTATMAESRQDFDALLGPIVKFVNETPDRVPVSDWYETTNGKKVGFQARSVVGGFWMKVLADKLAGSTGKGDAAPKADALDVGRRTSDVERSSDSNVQRPTSNAQRPSAAGLVALPTTAAPEKDAPDGIGEKKPGAGGQEPVANVVHPSGWKPVEGRLMTRWAKDVSPDKALPEYPRPQMVRKDWQNLNGLWDYAIQPKGVASRPDSYLGKILVPFPIESALSGVAKPVGPDNRLWYHRTFTVPDGWKGKRVLLHFGAVDWDATVSVNGKELGNHKGGYDPFSFDVTDALKDGAEDELVVNVWDPTDANWQPRGKQVRRPGGIMYTPTTGIWQTVWLEPVPDGHISSLRIEPDVDGSQVKIRVQTAGARGAVVDGDFFSATVVDEGKELPAPVGPNPSMVVHLENPKLWSPDSPHLYSLRVKFNNDEVESYFGMRKIALGKDDKDIARPMLNNKFVFQYGPLDQGFWPDGLYTAPTDEALKYDIEMTKKFGMNMARKHVKVEPDRWYYWCDKLGLLVWQDMPSGDKGIRPDQPDIERGKESTDNYEREWKAIIDANRNHPSIVMWVPFNEGWGQFDTARIVKMTKEYDPTRLVDNASGWADRGVGDVHDMHNYPGPGSPQPEPTRAAVLGEFGGLGLPVEGHTWVEKGNWGYRSFTDSKSLTDAYVGILRRMHPLIGQPGLSAAVYTQTTDVEVEVNGIMTYDRAVVKMDVDRIAEVAKKLHEPPPEFKTIVPDSRAEGQGQKWRFTFEKPTADDWMKPEFDDAKWGTGFGGFGTKATPGTNVRTDWKTPDVWVRRTFELPEGTTLNEPHLTMHHDEDAEVYINGVLAAKESGYVSGYDSFPISKEAAATLKPGKNTIAVHCHQTGGGQYIDVGIAVVKAAAK